MEHLKGNIEALSVELTDEELLEIDNAAPFDIGFPMTMLFETGGRTYSTLNNQFNSMVMAGPAGYFDVVQKTKAPKAHRLEE